MGTRTGPGFTLIELIAVIAVLGIVAAAAAPMVVTGFNAYSGAVTTAVTLDKLNYATERLAREMREVNVGSLNMNTAAPSFNRDDYAGTTATTRTVSVSLASGLVTLTYNPPGVTATLTDQASALSFAYFDQAGAPTTSAASVRYVEIGLTLAQGSNSISHSTRVALRNR